MLKKLRNKFILINMLTVGIVLLLIVLTITIFTYKQEIEFAKRTVKELATDKVMVYPAFSTKPPPLNPPDDEPRGDMPSQRAYTIIAYIDKNGDVGWLQNYLGEYSSEELTDIIKNISAEKSNEGTAYGVIYAKKKISNNVSDEHAIALDYSVVIAPLSAIHREVRGIFFIGLSVVLGAMCLFLFISWRLADIAIKPTAKAWGQQKRFIADASHDLKTPLTVIMANNEIMLSHKDKTVGELEKWLESTKAEGEHMRSLINKMLELARSESLLASIKLEDTNISELTEKTALQLEPVAYEKNIEINTKLENELLLKSNSEEYTRLLHILVDNAIKYAPIGGKITIELHSIKRGAVLSVTNSGTVIPKEELSNIFERFYRSDNARTNGGFGLGLSIAKNIALALNGEIQATSSEENGTSFIVKFKC